MEGTSNTGSRLEIFLSQSQFKKQVDSLGPDVFSFLSDMYEEGKFDEKIKEMFPIEKKKEFDEITEELYESNGTYRGELYKYLLNANDYRVKEVFGESYKTIMGIKDMLITRFGKSGYGSIYNNFMHAQFNNSLMEAEGDEFFYIGGKKFIPKDKDEELIWTFGKVLELLYAVNNG
jgi:hypothetical protein